MAGAAVDEIVLPMIEMNAMKEASLQWVWNRCRSDVCTRTEDRRRVKPDLKSDQGGLLIAEPK
jgi:hypothetical protein